MVTRQGYGCGFGNPQRIAACCTNGYQVVAVEPDPAAESDGAAVVDVAARVPYRRGICEEESGSICEGQSGSPRVATSAPNTTRDPDNMADNTR